MPRQARKKEKPSYPPTEIYAEQTLWNCHNLKTGLRTHINGVLAQVLKKYPQDYALELLRVEGGAR